MVWPDSEVSTSSGRKASPSGMFSTSPITPTALTLALRVASASMRAGDGGRARHVALHALHAGADLDRQAAGIETHALAHQRDGLGAFLAAIPLHHHQLAFARRALAHAQQRAEALLLHFGFAQNFDLHAQLRQLRLGAAGEFRRIKKIRRLVHQIAGEENAVGHRRQARMRLLRRRHIAGDDTQGLQLLFVFIQIAGAILVESIAFQTGAEGQMRRQLRLSSPCCPWAHRSR